MSGKSTFGTVRTLGSGKFQARYLVNGKQVSAGTYVTKKAAWAALARVQVEQEDGSWVDPAVGKVKFRDHAEAVLEHRKGDLRDTTRRHYAYVLQSLVYPAFGHKALKDITIEDIDRWWSKHQHIAAGRKNAYMTMRMVFRYAVRWGHIEASPCMVEKAGADASKPRPEFTVDDFKAVLAHSDLDQGALLWTVFGGHLRVAEAAGLNRRDYDRATGVLTVERQYPSGSKRCTPTKTGAVKKVKLLAPARAALEAHLDSTFGFPNDAMFVGQRGHRLRTDMIRRRWNEARKAAGLPTMHVHDLRHIGLTLVARSGATLKDIMSRGGHTTSGQALRYQHTSQEQDAKVADAADALLQ
ncbi:tyrosine-type recombinase/integrase [Curtobacterium flaccumfaciens]|uniref:tyrosine-type recombinase/integrase n=1 Tax=Curtobacterium flaccumfaciens TaxID=2035 RepID=UPI001E282693|nr:tyrosine-type recombinase/integrase [Curtobacterium allii]MCE0458432.1 tyrosine-type recombinase/integrase [Curtobacterium allii]